MDSVYSNKQLQEVAIPILCQYPIKQAWIIGDYANGRQTPTSVVEFLVELPEGTEVDVCFDAASDLEDILHREVIVRRVTASTPPATRSLRVLVYAR